VSAFRLFWTRNENFVNATQTESESGIRKNKKVKNLYFFACILDSIMLQSPHVIMEGVTLSVVKNIRNTAVPLNVCTAEFNI